MCMSVCVCVCVCVLMIVILRGWSCSNLLINFVGFIVFSRSCYDNKDVLHTIMFVSALDQFLTDYLGCYINFVY